MWSLTVPNLCLSFGQSSVDSWEWLWVYPPGITRRLMVRLSVLTRIWRGSCAVWRLRNIHLKLTPQFKNIVGDTVMVQGASSASPCFVVLSFSAAHDLSNQGWFCSKGAHRSRADFSHLLLVPATLINLPLLSLDLLVLRLMCCGIVLCVIYVLPLLVAVPRTLRQGVTADRCPRCSLGLVSFLVLCGRCISGGLHSLCCLLSTVWTALELPDNSSHFCSYGSLLWRLLFFYQSLIDCVQKSSAF